MFTMILFQSKSICCLNLKLSSVKNIIYLTIRHQFKTAAEFEIMYIL